MGIIVYIRSDYVAAAIQVIYSVLAAVLAYSIPWCILQWKAKQVLVHGETHLTEEDMADRIRISPRLCQFRRLSRREFICTIAAVSILVLQATVVLQTKRETCPYDSRKYAYKTKLSSTTCYHERLVATSGEAYALLIQRLVQLTDVEKDVPVWKHPSNFDPQKDELGGDGVYSKEDLWGAVIKNERCKYKIVYHFSNNHHSVQVSAELRNLTSDNSKPGLGSYTQTRASRFGYIRDRLETRTAVAYFKEISRKSLTEAYLVTGLTTETPTQRTIHSSVCAKITFRGQGLKVMPFANTAMQILTKDSNISRVIEVAWLGATLAEQIPRQSACVRANVKLSECTSLSNNTIFTLIGMACAVALLLLLRLYFFISNQKNPVKGLFTQYELLLSAIHDKPNSLSSSVPKKHRRTLVTLVRYNDSTTCLHWESPNPSSRNPSIPDTN